MTGVARIREGAPADTESVLALFDDAVAWLVARKQVRQWGEEPFSRHGARVARIAEWAASGGLRIAEAGDAEPVGALVLGARPPWVKPADRAERYIEALVTSRRHIGEDIGGELIRRAVQETRTAGVGLLRVDCWGEAPRLVAWYERQGFRRSATFDLNGWYGQVLSMDV
jgi:GNAT superfamily N-acetyltransferase